MTTDPCDTCLRWSECNSVDRDTCPVAMAADPIKSRSDTNEPRTSEGAAA